MFASDNWDDLWDDGSTWVVPAGDQTEAVLVFKKEREKDHYGEYIQDEGEVYMIFEVNGRYFKKTGYQSSYGYDRVWDGPVTEVHKVTKTIEVYE